jgi:hypothetical protein
MLNINSFSAWARLASSLRLKAYRAIRAFIRSNLLLIIYKEPQISAAKILFFPYLQHNLANLRTNNMTGFDLIK